MKRLIWCGLVVLLGMMAHAQTVLVGAVAPNAPGMAAAPAAEEIAVVKLITVNYLDLERVVTAFGGYTLNLYGQRGQKLGVIPDAAGGMRNFFNRGGTAGAGFTSPASNLPALTTPPAAPAGR